MTDKSSVLVQRLLEVTYANDGSKEQEVALAELTAYIESIEEKASRYDGLCD
jgi:hypothetical protein